MANQSIALSADLYDYLLDQGLREPGILQQLRAAPLISRSGRIPALS